MSETELVLYCRELGWIAAGWKSACGVLFIACVWYGCRYHFDVGVRLPRLKRTAKRLAEERDATRARAIKAEAESALLRSKMHTVGLEAEKAITLAGAKAARERGIRKKTEADLIAKNALLANEQDRATTLEGLLLAVNDSRVSPGSPDSWVPQMIVGSKSTT